MKDFKKGRIKRFVAPKLDFDYHDFEFNGCMWIEIDEDIILGKYGDIVYGLADGCVGYITPLEFQGKHLFPLMLYSNHETDYIEIKLYSRKRRKIIDLGEVEFTANMIDGTPQEPIIL
jgi:hypothetical protein